MGSYCYLLFNRYQISIWKNEKNYLHIDGGYDYTTMWKYLLPLNYILKNSQNDKIYVKGILQLKNEKNGRKCYCRILPQTSYFNLFRKAKG